MNRSGTDCDVVLSSRIRLARNVEGISFVSKMLPEEMESLKKDIGAELEANPHFSQFTIYDIDDLDELDRAILKERKIISERFYRKGSGLVVIDDSQETSLVTGDLDHIRVSSFADGLAVDSLMDKTLNLEEELSHKYTFAESEEFGYLTASIADSGMAMKGSVFLHLPVLSASELMDHLIIDTIKTNLDVTGFSGGGEQSLGGLYIISNKRGAPHSEKGLCELLSRSVSLFAENEREARERLLQGQFPILEDKIFRSYGLLKYCRQISEQEALSALSLVRLGVAVKWLENLNIVDFSSVFTSIGSSFLRSFAYENNPDENDIMRLRADTIRKGLNLNL